LNVQLSVHTGKLELEHDVFVDICPLCSQMEDHAHEVNLHSGSTPDEIDGDPLPLESRRYVLALMHGEGV
jgi:hypothetical protein